MVGVTVMVVVPDLPAVTTTEVAESVKDGGGGMTVTVAVPVDELSVALPL